MFHCRSMYALVFLNGPESIFQRWSPNPDGRRQGGEKERTIKANIVVKSVPANATAVIAAGKARSHTLSDKTVLFAMCDTFECFQ